jgi:hypothetical protein
LVGSIVAAFKCDSDVGGNDLKKADYSMSFIKKLTVWRRGFTPNQIHLQEDEQTGNGTVGGPFQSDGCWSGCSSLRGGFLIGNGDYEDVEQTVQEGPQQRHGTSDQPA